MNQNDLGSTALPTPGVEVIPSYIDMIQTSLSTNDTYQICVLKARQNRVYKQIFLDEWISTYSLDLDDTSLYDDTNRTDRIHVKRKESLIEFRNRVISTLSRYGDFDYKQMSSRAFNTEISNAYKAKVFIYHHYRNPQDYI